MCVGSRRSQADDASDRAALIAKIYSKLDDIAAQLARAAAASSTSEIDYARSYMDEVRRSVEELQRVQESDDTAKALVAASQGYFSGFTSATDALKLLKQEQPKADTYVQQCRGFNADLVAKAAAIHDDPTEADALTAAAVELGKKADSLLAEASNESSRVSSFQNEARRFSASGDHWSGVASKLSEAADVITQAFAVTYGVAKFECDPVQKQVAHPAVAAALSKLAGSSAGRKQLMPPLLQPSSRAS